MQPFSLTPSSGIAPRVTPRHLPVDFATIANNARLLTGALSSWVTPLTVEVPSKANDGIVTSIYKLTVSGVDYWLNWLSDVDVALSPLASGDRIYWTGDYEPRGTTVTLAIGGPDYPTTYYVLGVWKPVTAPSVSPTGGSGAASSRAYVYTHVTASGEEGAPSPASVVETGKVDDTWAITAMDAGPPNSGTVSAANHSAGVVTVTMDDTSGLRVGEQITFDDVVGMTDLNASFAIEEVTDATTIDVLLATAQSYSSGGTWDRDAGHNISLTRIYRTKDGLTTTDFFLVAEQASTLTTYNDTIADADLGSIIESETWLQPPTDMAGMIETSNQTLVGFSGKLLMFSVAGVPYAWPIANQFSVPYTIVSVASYDNIIYVLTDEEVWVAVGNTVQSIVLDPTGFRYPCVSKRSARAEAAGIFYASPDGLCLVGPGVSALLTERTILKRDASTIPGSKDWEVDYNPSTITGAFYLGMYFGFYDVIGGGKQGFTFSKDASLPYLVDLTYGVTGVYVDEKQRRLYVVNDNEIKEWDANTGQRLVVDWRSKMLESPKLINPVTCRIHADFDAFDENSDLDLQEAQRLIDIAYNAALIVSDDPIEGDINGMAVNVQDVNGSLLRDAGSSFSNRTLTFQLWAGGELKKSKSILNDKMFKLPGGYTATDFQINLSGNIDVYSVELAGTGDGLNLV
jgi:hypothetical protein